MEVKIDSSRMDVVKVGRIMGAIVIVIVLLDALAWVIEGEFTGVMRALSGLGMAFLILVATEILNAVLERNRQGSGSGDGASE